MLNEQCEKIEDRDDIIIIEQEQFLVRLHKYIYIRWLYDNNRGYILEINTNN